VCDGDAAHRARVEQGLHAWAASPSIRADFVVLGADPLSVDPHTIADIEVRETWIDGELAHSTRNPLFATTATTEDQS
jgi:hypothetical protein